METWEEKGYSGIEKYIKESLQGFEERIPPLPNEEEEE